MTTTSRTKSLFNQVLLKIDAKSLRENKQQKCIDCLNQDKIKISLSVKSVVAMNFMCPIIKTFHL